MLPHGKPVLLQDVAADPDSFAGMYLRVTGILSEYQAALNRATLEFKGATLALDTELVEMTMGTGRMIQCIGEARKDPEQGALVLRPKIVRDVDAMDMELYEKAINLCFK
ncbi:telomere-capping, CST complex subunit-domain-containing protein [Gongronella butleri]|nr:telomere-capping, CST complex subunit-domain-containing protein [Gongronella butleri]